MKKIVPDPPHLKLVTPLPSVIHVDLIPPDALAVADDLLLRISEALDKYCHANIDLPGLNSLAKARRSADTARALIEHALSRL
ncbi:hypothetical protein ACQKPE_08110 [Pseudomonas sp. NPDC089554]|uniref:hypothetical protein n=1 Tax=Pseudomonas sp. NPDC089554 TaxID=3390653 RepID=UPI003D02D366